MFWLDNLYCIGGQQRQILDLIWNLPALDVRHVPECGILILYSFNVKTIRIFNFYGLCQIGYGYIDYFLIHMAVQCHCFLVLNSNGWADFLSNPVLPFCSIHGVHIIYVPWNSADPLP